MKPVHEMTVAEALEVANRRMLNRQLGRPLDAPPILTAMLTTTDHTTALAVRSVYPRPSRAGEGARQREHRIQRALFDRINDPAEQMRRPALALVHAVPNGASASSPTAAGKRKAEGQKPGVPDIDCPVARGGYIGLRIELKKPRGTTTPEQAHWMSALAREGHKVALHTTTEGAWAELVAYLDQPRTAITLSPLLP